MHQANFTTLNSRPGLGCIHQLHTTKQITRQRIRAAHPTSTRPAARWRQVSAAMTDSYSIWIKPAGYMLVKLQQEIATQAQEFGAPLFEPHVTLLPGIDGDQEQIITTMQQLAQNIKKFRLNFLNVVHGQTFHKCVYILVAKEEAIMAAGAAAQQAFGKPTTDFMPHLSLLYADVDDATRAASQQAAVQRLYGEGSDYTTLLTDNGFVAETISLWYTPAADRSLASWKQVAECQLS